MSTIKTRTTLEKINIVSKKTLDGLNLADYTGQMFGVVDDDEALMFAEAERQKSKNLADNNDFESGDITNHGKNPSSSSTHMRSKNFIKVLPNTTYTFSVFGATPVDGSVKLYTEQSMSTGTHPFPVITSFPYTFTTKDDTNYVKLVLQYSREEVAILNNKDVQLEEGSIATDFQPYNGAITHNGDAPIVFVESERQKSKNLFDKNNVLSGRSLMDTGGIRENSLYYVSSYIKVNGLESIYISSTGKTSGKDNCFYDENKSFIGLVSAIQGVVSVPSGAFYMRFNGLLTELDNNVQVEAGDVVTEYQPYNGAIVNEGYFYHRPKIDLNKTINDNDFIIETYMSSDGKTWYRKWASGWKECGGIFTATGTGLSESSSASVTLDFTLPISFSATTYSVHLTNIWMGTGSHSVDWDSGGLSDKTNNGFKLVAIRQYTHKGAGDTVGCNWYCCGY
jgi:hypothetical protein